MWKGGKETKIMKRKMRLVGAWLLGVSGTAFGLRGMGFETDMLLKMNTEFLLGLAITGLAFWAFAELLSDDSSSN